MLGLEQNPIEKSRVQIEDTDFMVSDREDDLEFAFEESKNMEIDWYRRIIKILSICIAINQ